MAEIKTGVLLTLRDQYSAAMGKAGQATTNFSKGAVGELNKIEGAFSGLGAKLAGVGAGLAVGTLVKSTVDLSAKMERLGTQANVSSEKMAELKKNIFETANAPEIKVDPQQIIGAIDQIVERTGDMKFVEGNIRTIGMAIQATGAQGEAIGGLLAEFQKMGMGAGEALKTLDLLTIQGKEGAFTLENLASLGPRVISSYSATGRTGYQAAKEMGAVLQVIRMGTGSSEQAATAFEAMMRTYTDPKKQENLRALGVEVRDQAGNFKPVNDLMLEVIKNSDASLEVLGGVFDSEAMRSFNSSIAEFQKKGGLENLAKFMKMEGTGDTLKEDSVRNAATLSSNLLNLRTAALRFADVKLTEPIGALAAAINKLTENPERLQRYFDYIAHGAKVFIAFKVATKGIAAFDAIKAAWATAPQSTASGTALASAARGGVVPVQVMNWPVGGMGGSGGGGKSISGYGGSTSAAGGRSRTRSGRGAYADLPVQEGATGFAAALKNRGSASLSQARGFTKTSLFMSAMLSGWDLFSLLNNDELSKVEKLKGASGIAGNLGGSVAGGAAGAALGSFIFPGVGTLVGGLAGSLIGGWLGEKGGEGAYSLLTSESKLPAPLASDAGGNMEITLNAYTDAPSTHLDIAKIRNDIKGVNVQTGRYEQARAMP